MTDEDATAIKARFQGRRSRELQGSLVDADPGMGEYAESFVFSKVFSRPGLSHQDRVLFAIVAASSAKLHTALRNYLHGGLQDGMSPRRIHEAIVMLNTYIGFPLTIEALFIWRQVIESENRRGACIELDLSDVLQSGTGFNAPANLYSQGDLDLSLVDPDLASWIKDFQFDTVWARDGLPPADRLLVAIVALVATGNVSALAAHLQLAIDQAVEPRRVHEVLVMLSCYIGFPRAIEALFRWREVVVVNRRAGREIDVPVA